MNIYTLVYDGNYGYNLIEEKSKMGVCGGRFVALSQHEKIVKDLNERIEKLKISKIMNISLEDLFSVAEITRDMFGPFQFEVMSDPSDPDYEFISFSVNYASPNKDFKLLIEKELEWGRKVGQVTDADLRIIIYP